MSFVPGDLDTSQRLDVTLPLRHFLVGLGFLLAGVAVGVGVATGRAPGLGTLAHVHLLLVGWVCVTIMGAMTQFVPVWSGTSLHSRRLARLQVVLVTVGLAGFAAGLLAGDLRLLVPSGALLLAGFWMFAYNVGRTLAGVAQYDVTERHFLLSLGFFLALTPLGLLLAVDLNWPVLVAVSVTHDGLLGAHATIAVFGGVLTTVYGALYQLGTMFTQTDLQGVDHRLRAVEELAHPAGVTLLATGRLFDTVAVARVGALLLLVAAVSFGLVLVRKLAEMQVEWTPMHRRYAVVTAALLGWAALSAPAWVADPTGADRLFGAPGTVHLLALGVVGFVVTGTLYHVVPFLVWVDRYSDLVGLEAVPMIDDLYDDRLAAADLALFLAGTALLVAADLGALGPTAIAVGGLSVGAGVVVFTANVLLVVHRHSPVPLDRVLLGSYSPRPTPTDGERQSVRKRRH